MIISYPYRIVKYESEVMTVTEDERITLERAAEIAGIDVRNMRRYRDRLGGRYDDMLVPQRQRVVTLDRKAFEAWLVKRGKSAPDNVPSGAPSS